MILKSKLIRIVLIAIFLLGLYFCFRANSISNKGSIPSPKNNVPSKNIIIDKEDGKKATVLEGGEYHGTGSMELSPAAKKFYSSDSVNIEDYSYSIHKEERNILITPGVVVQPGKGINVKIPGGEQTIRIKRDNAYRSSEYKILLEKKLK